MAVTSVSHVWTQVIKPSGLPQFPADVPITITAPEAVDVEQLILGGATATLFVGSIDNTKIVSCAFHSSAANVFFHTPSQSLNLSTAKALGWNNQMPATATNPITAPMTSVVVDNSANPTTGTTFRMSVLVQP